MIMDKREQQPAGPADDAVGIVVQGGAPEQHRPRAVAFVYGGRVRPAPSLPYGRWKGGIRPAA
jgi:hypothetical protein